MCILTRVLIEIKKILICSIFCLLIGIAHKYCLLFTVVLCNKNMLFFRTFVQQLRYFFYN